MRLEGAKCLRSTDKAILVDVVDLDEPIWVPQSQVDDDSEVWILGDEGTLIVTDWWAEKNGLL